MGSRGWVSGLGYWVSTYGFSIQDRKVSGFGLRVWGFGFRVMFLLVWAFRLRIQDPGFKTLGIWFSVQGSGYKVEGGSESPSCRVEG